MEIILAGFTIAKRRDADVIDTAQIALTTAVGARAAALLLTLTTDFAIAKSTGPAMK